MGTANLTKQAAEGKKILKSLLHRQVQDQIDVVTKLTNRNKSMAAQRVVMTDKLNLVNNLHVMCRLV